MTTDELAAACEAAEGPSRELMEAVFDAIDPAPDCDWQNWSSERISKQDADDKAAFSAWLDRDKRRMKFYRLLDAEAYLDAAMLMVPEGWHIEGFKQGCGATPVRIVVHCWYDIERGSAKTPALALCAASLRARAG